MGEMFVQFFDGVLAAYLRGYSSLCILRPTCGEGVALEFNGDVYSCDHFVDPPYLLGNIMETPIGDLVRSDKQRAFGEAKRDTLPRYCRECEFLFACNGECPKNRILLTPDGEPGLNWLCEGLKHFFAHTDRRMKMLAGAARSGPRRRATSCRCSPRKPREPVATTPARAAAAGSTRPAAAREQVRPSPSRLLPHAADALADEHDAEHEQQHRHDGRVVHAEPRLPAVERVPGRVATGEVDDHRHDDPDAPDEHEHQ